MYAGGFHGWAQLVADGVKFVQKEDITPRAADRWVFRLAPAVALVPYLVALATIPVHPGVAVIDVPGSLVLVLAATSVGALGTLMAGWASANKYALLGGLRAAAQLVVLRAADRPGPRLDRAGRRLALARDPHRAVVAVVDAVAAPRRARLPRRRVRRAAASALRHARGRRRARHGGLDRVHRAALRVLPPRRVRRHRRHVAALRHALARRLARAVPRVPGLGVDPAQGLRRRRGRHLGAGRVAAPARGPAAAARLGLVRPARDRPGRADRSRRGGDR